jgi:hypothetical protein
MGVKAVEMVRKIRDKNFEETKRLSIDKQVDFVKRKAGELQKKLRIEHPRQNNRPHSVKI